MKNSIKKRVVAALILIALGGITANLVAVKETKDISTSKTGDWLNQSK